MGLDLDETKKCMGLKRDGGRCNNMGIYKSFVASSHKFCRHHVPKSEDKCVICLSELYDICMIPCRHTFHSKCIHKWMSKQNSCPVCRNSIFTNIETESFSEVLNSFRGDGLQIAIDIALVSHSADELTQIAQELCI
jgi:hypothetical protein